MDPVTAAMLAKLLIPIVTPIIVHVLKSLAPLVVSHLPSWAVPILAPLIGSVLGALTTGDPTTGAVLGLAGVGMREITHQTVTKAKG